MRNFVPKTTKKQSSNSFTPFLLFSSFSHLPFSVLRYYSAAIALDPLNHLTFGNRSLVLHHLGQFEKVYPHFIPATSLLLSFWQGSHLSLLSLSLQSLDDAESALQLNPRYVKAFARKGAALLSLERYAEAKEAYEAGLQVDIANLLQMRNSYILLFTLLFSSLLFSSSLPLFSSPLLSSSLYSITQVDGSVKELQQGVENCVREMEMTSAAAQIAKHNLRSLHQVSLSLSHVRICIHY
jgi:tetratricopeptide (TPR) repeat protein